MHRYSKVNSQGQAIAVLSSHSSPTLSPCIFSQQPPGPPTRPARGNLCPRIFTPDSLPSLMGSSSSKASRLAGTTATKRTYPQRVPPTPAAAAAPPPPPPPPQPARDTLASSTSSNPPPSPPTSPTANPNLQASATKTKGIITRPAQLFNHLLPSPHPSISPHI